MADWDGSGGLASGFLFRPISAGLMKRGWPCIHPLVQVRSQKVAGAIQGCVGSLLPFAEQGLGLFIRFCRGSAGEDVAASCAGWAHKRFTDQDQVVGWNWSLTDFAWQSWVARRRGRGRDGRSALRLPGRQEASERQPVHNSPFVAHGRCLLPVRGFFLRIVLTTRICLS